MRCAQCGAELKPGEQQCSNCCRTETGVHILTPEDNRQFNGVTLEQEGQHDAGGGNYEYRSSQFGRQVHIRHINLAGTGLLAKLLIGAILALLVFIVLPIAFFVAAVGIIIWVLLRRR